MEMEGIPLSMLFKRKLIEFRHLEEILMIKRADDDNKCADAAGDDLRKPFPSAAASHGTTSGRRRFPLPPFLVP